MARIFTKNNNDAVPEIDEQAVKEFFRQRAEKLCNGSVSYKQAIIYQDKNESLAESRDYAEKKLLLPKLHISKYDRLLDIGCGTGRWAEVLVDKVGYYQGTDMVQELLDEAMKRVSFAGAKFSNLSCTELSLDSLQADTPFNKIICLGVLIYLNDKDLYLTLQNLCNVADQKCLIMLREPVALFNRLTIKEHYSDDMDQFYNAIYRTEDELLAYCNTVFDSSGFELHESGDVYNNPEFNNRTETKQKYYIYRRAK